MQKLWASRCEWDAVLPEKLFTAWRNFYAHLSTLREVSIPRWIEYGSDTVSAEIHGFADASTTAYGAVVYLKLIKLDGSVQITLISAKSRVAPLKPMTVPRLELCATVLLARLIVFVRSLLDTPSMICHCWADSTVALAWLKQSPSRWKVFVANRVHEVQSTSGRNMASRCLTAKSCRSRVTRSQSGRHRRAVIMVARPRVA